MTTCTIPGCGGAAVTTFTGRNGETFAECATHDARSSVPATAADTGVVRRTASGITTITVDGASVRTTRGARFVAVRRTATRLVVVTSGGDERAVRARAARAGFSHLVDTHTGAVL